MNILIVQQLAWARQIGHAIARALHGQGHTLSALVYGIGARAQVERQRDVSYAHVYFADPLYDQGHEAVPPARVQEIEERYGLGSLARIAYADRLLSMTLTSSRHLLPRRPVSNDYVLSVCWSMYETVREMVDRVKPDYVLAPVIGSLANYLLYLECRYRRIPFFTIASTRFAKAFYVADDEYLCSSRIRARFETLREDPRRSARYEEARKLYDGIRDADPDARPSYARIVQRSTRSSVSTGSRVLLSSALLPARVLWALRRRPRVMAIRNIWLPSNSRWNAVRSTLLAFRESIAPPDRQPTKLMSLDDVRFPYVFFPLHVEPELSLLVFAPEHANQIELCRRVAISLPRGVRLLVKEHPAMMRVRQRRFYEDLAGLVNVEVIHSSVSSRDIVRDDRCRGVLVVSSTVGFEAALSGRAVVMLGPADFHVLPAVYRASSLEDAIERLRGLCKAEVPSQMQGADEVNIAYLCAVIENGFSLDYMEVWTSGRGHADIEILVKTLQERAVECAP